MKIKFAWYDMWVGAYWDREKKILYICPIPMVLITPSTNMKTRLLKKLRKEARRNYDVFRYDKTRYVVKELLLDRYYIAVNTRIYDDPEKAIEACAEKRRDFISGKIRTMRYNSDKRIRQSI